MIFHFGFCNSDLGLRTAVIEAKENSRRIFVGCHRFDFRCSCCLLNLLNHFQDLDSPSQRAF